jgi:hypothetical protein
VTHIPHCCIPPIALTTYSSCRLEVNCRLSQDAACQGGPSNEQNVSLEQKGARRVRTCSDCDVAPQSARRCSPPLRLLQHHFFQGHVCVLRLSWDTRRLNNEDRYSVAFEVDIFGDGDICAEGVDARCQWIIFCVYEFTKLSRSKIELIAIPRG